MTRRRCLAATLVVVLLGAAGCGGAEPTDPAASLEHRLAGMPGMRAASVQVEEVDDGLVSTLVVVDADPDATARQLAAVDLAIGHTRPLAGSTQTGGEIYLGAGTTALIDDRADAERRHLKQLSVPVTTRSGGSAPSPQRYAASLLSAARALPNAAVSLDDVQLEIDLPERSHSAESSGAHDAVAGAMRTLLATHVRRAASRLVVTAPGRTFTTDAALRPVDVRRWRTVARLGARSPAGTRVDLHAQRGGAVGLWLRLRLPGFVPPGRLTPARYGDRLWPILHGALDLLRRWPVGSSLTADNDYRRVAGQPADATDHFLVAVTGRPATADRLHREWNRLAAAYLRR